MGNRNLLRPSKIDLRVGGAVALRLAAWLRIKATRFGRSFTLSGLAGALVFFCFSLTPSFMPRDTVVQGVASGINTGIGYGVGSLAAWITVYAHVPRPNEQARLIAWFVLGLAALILVPGFLILGRWWQNDIRKVMGISPGNEGSVIWIVFLALVIAIASVLGGRLVRAVFRFITGYMLAWVPRPAALAVASAATVFLVVTSINGLVIDRIKDSVNSASSQSNRRTRDGTVQPVSVFRSSGPGSLVTWDSLGMMGRDFVGLGPDASQIAEVTGRPAMEPVRIYVGIQSAETIEERVDLVLAELDRTGGWDRSIITVVTTTGNGWVDPHAIGALEYMHGGDTTTVAIQYSYLPSWLPFLFNDDIAREAGAALTHAVRSRLETIPNDERPTLLVFGESLGSLGAEAAFDGLDDMLASVDGALFVGPVYKSPIHSAITDERDSGSPPWRPVFGNGKHVRFAAVGDDLLIPGETWEFPRIVYLQNATDPVVYWEPRLAWRTPEWIHHPRGPGVTNAMQWIPVVTFWHMTMDLFIANEVPDGFGHYYGSALVDAWVMISPPKAWTASDTSRLRTVIDNTPRVNGR